MGGLDRVKDPVTKIADSTPDPAYNGFGDVLNTGVYLHEFNGVVYAGTLVTNQSTQFTANSINGADIWKGTGAGDNISWTRVVGDGFGDPTVLQFQSFADYNAKMYLVASSVNSSDFRGNEPVNYPGAVVYRLATEAPECLNDGNCSEGYECVEGSCEPVIVDNPPAITAGPYLAAGYWPLLPTTAESALELNANYGVMWKFSDDLASCSGACTHVAQYQAVGGSSWTTLSVTTNAAKVQAWATLPVESLQDATYAFRFTVTDCAGHSTQSGTYYFKVLRDAPPAITGGPYLAAGVWPVLARSEQSAFALSQGSAVLWNFSDDYASCSGLVTHRAWYRMVGSEAWTSLAVSTNPAGTKYAYITLPSGLAAGTYQLLFDVRDCAGQYFTPGYYYFKVE
jgi:hypothetical protein